MDPVDLSRLRSLFLQVLPWFESPAGDRPSSGTARSRVRSRPCRQRSGVVDLGFSGDPKPTLSAVVRLSLTAVVGQRLSSADGQRICPPPLSTGAPVVALRSLAARSAAPSPGCNRACAVSAPFVLGSSASSAGSAGASSTRGTALCPSTLPAAAGTAGRTAGTSTGVSTWLVSFRPPLFLVPAAIPRSPSGAGSLLRWSRESVRVDLPDRRSTRLPRRSRSARQLRSVRCRPPGTPPDWHPRT